MSRWDQQVLEPLLDLAALNLDLELLTPFPGADPYVLASTLQKAIRRSDVHVARRAGHQLLALDRHPLWRRLSVIGLEDIGLGSIDVVAELIAISTTSDARRLLGGDAQALDVAVLRACEAVKDRTADHLGSIIGREQNLASERTFLASASISDLLAMIAAAAVPFVQRVRAALIVAGRGDSVTVTQFAPRIEAVFGLFREIGAPDVLIAACEAYGANSRDLDAYRCSACLVRVESVWRIDTAHDP